jgi:hypothetical protein
MARLRGLFRRGGRAPSDQDGRLEALERRVGHLETLIEGLQDSVHRETVRHEREIRELQRKTEPAELSRALSRDARERGI